MYDIERREKIVEILKERGSISVNKLSQLLYVSSATIRRDLVKMEQRGLVTRTFGGVTLTKKQVDKEVALEYRIEENAASKKNIARLIIPYIKNHMCIFLDSSSTILHVIPYLRDFETLTIVTNGLTTANRILLETSHAVVVTGGKIQVNSTSMSGPIATHSLSSLHVDLAIMSSSAIDKSFGLSESTFEQASIKRTVVQNSDIVAFLITENKFNKSDLCKTVDLKDIDILATNFKPSQDYIDLCEENNVTLKY